MRRVPRTWNGDVRRLLRRHVDAADLAASPEHDRTVVGRPLHRGVDAVDRPGLLHVAVEAVVDRTLASGLQVQHVEHGFVPDAPDEGQGLAVGGGSRADRAAGAGDVGLRLALLPVEPLDHVDLAIGILAILEGRPGGGVVGVVEVAAIGEKAGSPESFWSVRFLVSCTPSPPERW
jgi:hypothetical protein